uniref:Inducible T-cell costimulator n=1 Tax=Pelodiscus sinensis TaxID=13735 RepID=K7FA66_PELSI
MKSGVLTFGLLCFQLEALCGANPCSSHQLCKNREHSPVSETQMKVEFHSGIFKFNFDYPKNITEFSMKLLKGQEMQKICELNIYNGTSVPETNNSSCQPVHSGNNMSFILKDLESKHTGVYICCLEILLPAPYIDCRVNEIYFYIRDAEPSLVSEVMSWTLIGITAFSIVSCICCIVACCLRKKVSDALA